MFANLHQKEYDQNWFIEERISKGLTARSTKIFCPPSKALIFPFGLDKKAHWVNVMMIRFVDLGGRIEIISE